MPAEGHKSRRALLRLFGAAPALAILPAGSALALASTASPVHPDAALFAMQSAIDAADKEFNAALDALNAADDAYSDKEPDRPAQPRQTSCPKSGRRSTCLALPPDEGSKGPSPAWAAYNQAVQDHEREIERLKAECGVTAAHELEDATSEAVNSGAGRIGWRRPPRHWRG